MKPINLATPEEIAAFKARSSPHAGGMNKTEERYANHLEGLKRVGLIAHWSFEPEKLRLGCRCFLTPDFRVLGNTSLVEFHEVKGRKSNGRPYYREDAMVKLRVAADRYRTRKFFVVWPGPERGTWCSELVPHGGDDR